MTRLQSTCIGSLTVVVLAGCENPAATTSNVLLCSLAPAGSASIGGPFCYADSVPTSQRFTVVATSGPRSP